MLYTVNIIGCGRIGKTLGRLLATSKTAIIKGIVNSSIQSASEAVNFIKQGLAVNNLKELPKADIYFVTTRDDIIQLMASKLADDSILKEGSIVLHCSGSLSSDVLTKAKLRNCYIASIHPIKSFANPELSVSTFSGTYCAIEGDESAISVLTPMFEQIGGIVFRVNKENKAVYHAAGVIANNYLITLHYHALLCYKRAGVDEQIANKIISRLMNDALNNLKDLAHESALTGPIQRGDIKTLNNHAEALKNQEVTRNIYSALGIGTLPLTKHSEEIKKDLAITLNSD